MKILHLTLHKKWFDEIVSGRKTEEYREIKPYWDKRLKNKDFNEIHFKNGYNKNAPFMKIKWNGIKRSVFQGVLCYAIQLGKIIEIKNVNFSK